MFPMTRDQETNIEYGWVIWCLQISLRLLPWILLCGALHQLRGAAAQDLHELPSTDTCPMTDVVMNQEVESHSWLSDMLVTLALFGLLALCYGGGWLHGWWTGRNFILRRRHIRSDRLQRMLFERERQVFELEDELQETQRQLRNSLPSGPTTADRDIKKLQMQLRNLEHSFWYKDQQLRALDRKTYVLAAPHWTITWSGGRVPGFGSPSSNGIRKPCT